MDGAEQGMNSERSDVDMSAGLPRSMIELVLCTAVCQQNGRAKHVIRPTACETRRLERALFAIFVQLSRLNKPKQQTCGFFKLQPKIGLRCTFCPCRPPH